MKGEQTESSRGGPGPTLVNADRRPDTPSTRLDDTASMLREFSRQTDPQKLIEAFQHRWRTLPTGEYLLSISRRGLQQPWYRITRYTRWPDDFDPWKNQRKLPLFDRGLLSELIYTNEPHIINDFTPDPDDPAHDYLRGARSLLTLPQYDGGRALNVIVRMSTEPGFFDEDPVSDLLVMSNLMGRAVNGLVLARQLKQTYAELDFELSMVGRMQRSLLPLEIPTVPGLDIAVSYRTASRASGDYYDFFPLSDGRLGVLVADVSGHGTPAAVVMAMLRTMVHVECCIDVGPGELLARLNRRLAEQTGELTHRFVTAFYGVYDPVGGEFSYASAGHPPPLLRRGDEHISLGDAQSLPLGIEAATEFREAKVTLNPADVLIIFTDGITESTDARDRMFGLEGLINVSAQHRETAQNLIDAVGAELTDFTGDRPLDDDQTLVVLRKCDDQAE